MRWPCLIGRAAPHHQKCARAILDCSLQEHLLDWFHVTMRLTVLQQLRKELGAVAPTLPLDEVAVDLDRIKWCLWHGNVFRTLQLLDDVHDELDAASEEVPAATKLTKAVREFRSYIAANKAFIPNYGDRYRHGERIATGFVESTVNQVVSKRMVKQQQMRWTKRGAHLLLQVRTQVLNDDLWATFGRWYPGMASTNIAYAAAAYSPDLGWSPWRRIEATGAPRKATWPLTTPPR